jgi:NaMN:DMB phosphoribosyltransferase
MGEMNASDQLHTAIRDYAAGGYPVSLVIDSVCDCGSQIFELVFDDDAGVAARICTECESELGLADSEEHFDDADEVQQAECTCGNTTFTVATGFALDADGEVRWVSVGLRCTRDAVAGVYVDWKIDYLPSAHLLAQA